MKYVRDTMIQFLKTTTETPKQIISLGAGFDTSYWYLKKHKHLGPGDVYVELDFADLVARKKQYIESNDVLSELLGTQLITKDSLEAMIQEAQVSIRTLKREYEEAKKRGETNATLVNKREALKRLEVRINQWTNDLLTEDYKLIQGDLKQLKPIETRFQECGIDFTKPTLILTECVMNYIPPLESQAMIKWSSSVFQRVIFFTYDQIKPSDAFGHVMCSTLKKRNSTLFGIMASASPEKIENKFRASGYSSAYSIDIWQCYNRGLHVEERQRIDRLEEFDEFEEWIIKCQHYSLTLAEKNANDLVDQIKSIYPKENHTYTPLPLCENILQGYQWSVHKGYEEKSSTLNRWGHAVISHNNHIILYGGFTGNSHQDSTLQMVDIKTMKSEPIKIMGTVPSQAKKFHTLTVFQTDQDVTEAVVFGGRGGPRAPSNEFIGMKWHGNTVTFEKPEVQGTVPTPRWRHSATTLAYKDKNVLVVFGGRTTSQVQNVFDALNDLYIIDPSTWTSCKVEVKGDIPDPRFSHTTIAIENNTKMLLFGGTDGEKIYDDSYIFDVDTSTWTKLNTTNTPPPMFSHESVLIESMGKPYQLVIGGSGHTGVHLFHLLDIQDLTWYSFAPTTSLKDNQHLLSKHKAVLIGNDVYIVGGGCLCFSFGTFYNPIIVLSLPSAEKVVDSTPLSVQIKKEEPLASVGPDGRILLKVYETVTEEQLKNEIFTKRVPVIIKNLNMGKCKELWTKDYMKSKCKKKVSTRICNERRLDFIHKNFRFETMGFDTFLDKVYDSKVEDRFYFRSVGENARKDRSDFWLSFPEFGPDFIIPEPFASCIRERVFSSAFRISSSDSQLWSHFDVCDNILCHIVGRKEVVLWAPEDAQNLYIDDSSSPILNIDRPDLEKYPKFKDAQAYYGVLEPGDTLFIPALWLHNVLTLEPSVSINIFWKDLDDSFYHSKDLYGNRMPVPVENAFKKMEEVVKAFELVPEPYKSFYARYMITQIEKQLGLE